MRKLERLACLVAIAGILSEPDVFAGQKDVPKYDATKVEAAYDQWIEQLRDVPVPAGYRKAIEDLLSDDERLQLAAMSVLGKSQDLRVLPWLVPFIDNENTRLRIWAGSAIDKVLYGYIHQGRDDNKTRMARIEELRPAAWIAIKIFKNPDDGSSWAFASRISGYLGLKELEDELRLAIKSKHPTVSNNARGALIELLGKAE